MKKRIEKFSKVLLSCYILFSILSVNAQFAGGSGTEEDPYQIKTTEHLNNIRTYATPGQHFIQNADIDLGIPPYNEGEGWVPLSISGEEDRLLPFSGSYNGNGYAICNLYINRPQGTEQGLFATFHHASFLNINLRNISITSRGTTGGIAGRGHLSVDSTIDNCYVQGKISAEVSAGGLVSYIFSGLVITNSHVDIDISGSGFVGGLAGSLRRSRIENSSSSGTVTGGSYVGGLTGELSHSTILGSHNSANVTGTSMFTGGLAGNTWWAVIENSFNEGTVSGYRFVGGLAGKNNMRIEQSYNTGQVVGEKSVGGLAGVNNGRIENSYCTGHIKGYEEVGGLVGYNDDFSYITNSYSVGIVEAGVISGRIVGLADPYGFSQNCFWNLDIPALKDGDNGTGLTTSDMVHKQSYINAGWDFNEIWQIKEGESYPFHQWQEGAMGHNRFIPYNLKADLRDGQARLSWNIFTPDAVQSFNIYRNQEIIANVREHTYIDSGLMNFIDYQYAVTALYEEGETPVLNLITFTPHPGFSRGKGVKEDPFIIETAEQLNYVRYHKDAVFEQNNDIDLLALEHKRDLSWQPIGNRINPFSGSYNGNGYAIYNLIIEDQDEDGTGLFGVTQFAELKNMRLFRTDVGGSQNIGGLIGLAESSSIHNSSVQGTVTASLRNAGLLIGRTRHSTTVSQCYSAGKVEVGIFSNLKTDDDYNNMDNQYRESLNIWENCGGLIGLIEDSSIINCYSTAFTEGWWNMGGLIGKTTGSMIINSYSIGRVLGIERIGGLIGLNEESDVLNCYWNIETSYKSSSAGGNGRTTEQMIFPYNENTYVNWDFADIWASDTEQQINNGYPYIFDNYCVGISVEEDIDASETLTQLTIYPNPFNPETTIAFHNNRTGNITIDIYNIRGRKVRKIIDDVYNIGEQRIIWDGRNNIGIMQPSGVYFIRIKSDDYEKIRKVMLLK